MPTFRIVKCPFPPSQTSRELATHLTEVLRKLRRARAINPSDPSKRAEEEQGALSSPPPEGFQSPIVHLVEDDYDKISRRAKALTERRQAASGLAHLKKEDRDRLLPLRDGINLVRLSSEHRADEIAAEMHAEFPWMDMATEKVWHDARRSVREGWIALHFSPILLVGPPGAGKSTWARHLASAIGTPSVEVEATVESASFGILGSQRGWGNSAPGRLVNTILRTKVGNPITIIDEVEKAGSVTSNQGRNFDLCNGLLPLLEPSTASKWSCPFFEVPFDMSLVSWILTANDIAPVSAPLRSRCPPILVGLPTKQHLIAFSERVGHRRGLTEMGIGIVQELIDRRAGAASLSLRMVLRMIDRALALENKPRLN